MEASRQGNGPAWLPSGLDADALKEKLRGLKEKTTGDSRGEMVASVRQNFQGLKEQALAGTGSQGATASASGGAAGATVPTPPFEERPELYVGAAFAGGLALAGVLRLLGR